MNSSHPADDAWMQEAFKATCSPDLVSRNAKAYMQVRHTTDSPLDPATVQALVAEMIEGPVTWDMVLNIIGKKEGK